MIIRSKDYIDETTGMPTPKMLKSCIKEHLGNVERLKKLKAAYDCQGEIMSRTRRRGLPNNKIAHPIARYITTMSTGYMIGNPVSYEMSTDDATLQAIQDIFHKINIDAEDAQLARDQSIYGTGVEYVHVDAQGDPRSRAIDPQRAFVVYSDSYDQESLFGVYFNDFLKENGTKDGYNVWVMTPLVIAFFYVKDFDQLNAPQSIEPHYFGGVPIVEYWNDETMQGDFERVLPSIDAYDKLQSDRVNDKEQCVDKLLVLTGAILETDDEGRTPHQQLIDDKALQLPDPQSKAEYLSSPMHEADIEVLRTSIADDIFKLSMVPDMSDKNFAANVSGVAMRYKLLGFEQIIRIKERWFTEALKTRLKLFSNYLNIRTNSALLNVADVKITFTHALPANILENAQTALTAVNSGAVSLETSVRMLHTGEDWSDEDIAAEVERINADKQSEAVTALAMDNGFADNEG